MLGNDGISYYFGHTGWRCCTRRNGSYFTDTDNSRVRDDLFSFLTGNIANTMWFVFIDRPGDWIFRDDPKIVKNLLASAKCNEGSEKKLRGVLIHSYHC